MGPRRARGRRPCRLRRQAPLPQGGGRLRLDRIDLADAHRQRRRLGAGPSPQAPVPLRAGEGDGRRLRHRRVELHPVRHGRHPRRRRMDRHQRRRRPSLRPLRLAGRAALPPRSDGGVRRSVPRPRSPARDRTPAARPSGGRRAGSRDAVPRGVRRGAHEIRPPALLRPVHVARPQRRPGARRPRSGRPLTRRARQPARSGPGQFHRVPRRWIDHRQLRRAIRRDEVRASRGVRTRAVRARHRPRRAPRPGVGPGLRVRPGRGEAQLRSIVDPDDANARAFASQDALIAEFGGRDALLEAFNFDHTPVPVS